MLSVDAVSGEIYLQLQSKSKAEYVAAYLADLCQDCLKDKYTKIGIVLDNNSTHKQKMKGLSHDFLVTREIADKIEVEFLHSPPYSPDFNLAEFEIHLLRLEKLHRSGRTEVNRLSFETICHRSLLPLDCFFECIIADCQKFHKKGSRREPFLLNTTAFRKTFIYFRFKIISAIVGRKMTRTNILEQF
jgi:hypothetical protein